MRVFGNSAAQRNPALQLSGALSSQPGGTTSATVIQDTSVTSTAAAAPQTASGLRQLRRALGQTILGATQTQLARQALVKMEQGYKALTQAGDLDSAVAQIMAEQSKQNTDRISSAKGRVRSHFKTLEQQSLHKMKLIQDKIKAEKKAGFWGKIVALFKGLAAALSAASSIVTGPFGAVAAGLIVASMAVAATWDGEAARWISLGLSLGAAAAGGIASFAEVAGTVAKVASKAMQAASSCASLLGAGSGMAQSAYSAEGLDKQSALLKVRAVCQELLAQAEEERDLMERLLEYQGRSLDLVLKTMSNTDHNARAAISGFATGR